MDVLSNDALRTSAHLIHFKINRMNNTVKRTAFRSATCLTHYQVFDADKKRIVEQNNAIFKSVLDVSPKYRMIPALTNELVSQ